MAKRYFDNPYRDVTDPNQPLVICPSRALQLAVDTLTTCFDNVAPTPRTFDGGLYTGYIGIAWAALHVLRHRPDEDAVRTFILTKAAQFVQAGLTHLGTLRTAYKEDKISLLLGFPGVWLTAAMLFHTTDQKQLRDEYLKAYTQLANEFAVQQIFPQGSDEFFIGRAGYLAGIATLRAYTGETLLSDDVVNSLCDAVIQSGQSYARQHGSPCPLMYAYHDTEYLGAGHGLAGVLFALMLFPAYLARRPAGERLVRDTLAYMIGITPGETDNLPAALDEMPGAQGPHHQRAAADQLVHWCHGATGAVLVYARAFVLWKDPRYLAECRRCANLVWRCGLLKKGPGICHGVAGSGYVFLLLHRLTGELAHLHRASAFADFMQSDTFGHARRPDAPFSLYEGLAGTACFYADLANPAKAGFPFMDPLWDVSDWETPVPSAASQL